MQRDVRALENSPGAHREVFFALVTTIEAILARRDPFTKAAYRAFWAFRPKILFQIDARRLLVWKHLEQFEG
jgi:hypothetical protein